VLESLRWRLEAEKSVKIGEELQFLVLEQQHEISELRSHLHTARQDIAHTDTEIEVVQLRKDLRQARRDNEALGRRVVSEEERAEQHQRSLQAVEQEKRMLEQVNLHYSVFCLCVSEKYTHCETCMYSSIICMCIYRNDELFRRRLTNF